MSILARKMHAVTDDTADLAGAVFDKGSEQLNEFLDDVDDLLQLSPIKDEAARRARNRGGSLLGSAQRFAERRASKAVDQASSAARSAARTTDGYVRSSPWTAIGVAAIAGIAVA